jgi:hypothetical protein
MSGSLGGHFTLAKTIERIKLEQLAISAIFPLSLSLSLLLGTRAAKTNCSSDQQIKAKTNCNFPLSLSSFEVSQIFLIPLQRYLCFSSFINNLLVFFFKEFYIIMKTREKKDKYTKY